MSKPDLHDRINAVLDVVVTCALIGFVGWTLYTKTGAAGTPTPASSGQLLVECAPIVRGEVTRTLADQVTMESGTTRYFDLSDSSFHQTTAPCATFEVRGK